MPTISLFYGIIVRIYYGPREHSPPHVHVYYQDCHAILDIEQALITEGSLPARQRKLVEAWALLRKDDLLADWSLAASGSAPLPIEPLK